MQMPCATCLTLPKTKSIGQAFRCTKEWLVDSADGLCELIIPSNRVGCVELITLHLLHKGSTNIYTRGVEEFRGTTKLYFWKERAMRKLSFNAPGE